MNNKKILILEGGYNEEHEVSLKTSAEIQKVLRQMKVNFKKLRVNPKNFTTKIRKYKNYICFNALHGPYGEDGQIQNILNKNKIKYTHSSAKSSNICFDKFKSKKIILNNKILTPKSIIIKIDDLDVNKVIEIKKKFKKFIIKPNNSGSSFGIQIVENKIQFEKFLEDINIFKTKFSSHKKFIVEEFIKGKELTVSTINFSNKIEALGVTEIKHDKSFFDYQSKYSKGLAKHILPAKITKKNYEKCLNLAIRAHSLLRCKSIARTDFILNTNNNKIYFLETNSQPGLTSVSLLPEQAKYKKISFPEIILNIIQNAT